MSRQPIANPPGSTGIGLLSQNELYDAHIKLLWDMAGLHTDLTALQQRAETAERERDTFQTQAEVFARC